MKFQENDNIRFITFDIFKQGVVHAVFTRHGGTSPEPWNALNVGGTVGDINERVRENRYLSFSALGLDRNSMFDVWQVHSADVVIANAPHPPNGLNRRELMADGIITDHPEISLFMRFADCTPILLYDPWKKAIGIVHAGWQGTVKHVAYQTVMAMKAAYGSRPGDILSAIGPSIGPDHYEVGPDVIERVLHSFGSDSATLLHQIGNKTHFDLWEANRISLQRAGVIQTEVAGLCTACHSEDWYSHRRENGKTGRFGALIALAR